VAEIPGAFQPDQYHNPENVRDRLSATSGPASSVYTWTGTPRPHPRHRHRRTSHRGRDLRPTSEPRGSCDELVFATRRSRRIETATLPSSTRSRASRDSSEARVVIREPGTDADRTTVNAVEVGPGARSTRRRLIPAVRSRTTSVARCHSDDPWMADPTGILRVRGAEFRVAEDSVPRGCGTGRVEGARDLRHQAVATSSRSPDAQARARWGTRSPRSRTPRSNAIFLGSSCPASRRCTVATRAATIARPTGVPDVGSTIVRPGAAFRRARRLGPSTPRCGLPLRRDS